MTAPADVKTPPLSLDRMARKLLDDVPEYAERERWLRIATAALAAAYRAGHLAGQRAAREDVACMAESIDEDWLATNIRDLPLAEPPPAPDSHQVEGHSPSVDSRQDSHHAPPAPKEGE